MSSNHHEKMNESIDGFNLSKEELMNCFGSQISSQSSKSNYDYQNDCNPSDIQFKNMGQNQIQIQAQNKDVVENSNGSKNFANCINKDDILRNICHGFIDMFFSQKEELRGIKDEIRKLQNMMLNNNNSNKNNMPLTKKIKINNQKSLIYNQNNNINNNENFNYSFKNSKKNTFLNNSNNPFIEEQNNQLNQPKKEPKKEVKKQLMPILANSKISRGKSPNIHINPKSSVPETVVEVDEEYELTATRKQNRIKEREKENARENIAKKQLEDPFLQENLEENNFKFEDINDDEFDELLKRGKNKKGNLNPLLGNDPFQKSSELKKRPEQNSPNKDNNGNSNDINDNNNINVNNENETENDLGLINFDSDEIVSDFMVGGKKINIKINDDIRKKINTLDEPIDKLEELDKNKEPSNIFHNTSKLSCTSIMSKAKNNLNNNNNVNSNNDSKIKEITSRLKPVKRNYITMIENSKKIIENEKDNLKNEEIKNNGSSVKERGGFRKKLKKFGNSNNYNIINKIEITTNKNNSNPSSLNNTQNKVLSLKKMNKKIKNKKYIYSSISTCQFYCLCQKNNCNKNTKCPICQDTAIINITNFMIGFYYYIINNKDKNNIEIDTSDSTFKLLIEKDSDNNQFKELQQFFNYQFIYITYDKYLKITRENNNTNELQIENLIEDIYDKLTLKYIDIFIKGKRSFLTEVAEGDSTLGHMNILLFLMNINLNSDSSTGEKTIEFSDGYKSCYAVINNSDPINLLMNQLILHNWMNVEIGMSKVLNIDENFRIFIKIYYNSIAPSDNFDSNKNNHIYGPLQEKKCLPKNILEINNNGGEISLINVIIVKKYDFFVNNLTKKVRYSRKKYENEIMKIPDSDHKNYNNNDSEGKNKNNNNEIKEPDKIIFNFKAVAMDYEIYNNIKKNTNNKSFIDHLLKKRYTIEFFVKYQEIYENICEGKMYQLMYLNLEHKNNSNNNNNQLNQNVNYNTNHYYNSNDNNVQIKFSDKSQINEIQLNLNYKSEKEYLDCNELINKHLNLTNNIDIGKLFVESIDNDKQINNDEYLNKEFFITGIYSGYIDKIRYNLSSENNNEENKNGNEAGGNDEYIERYIFLSIGIEKIAIIKLHKEDFFYIDVKSNIIKDKIFNCYDVLYKEILYFDNNNNQPKITGRKKYDNSIPLLNLETNSYTSINFGNYSKNKEQIDLFIKYKESNKMLIDMLTETIG